MNLVSLVKVNFSYHQLGFLEMNQNFVFYVADSQDFGSKNELEITIGIGQ